MNKKCNVCGFAGENVWRDGKYFCASCGSEIDVTQPGGYPETQPPVNPNPAANRMPVSAVCPICKNSNNNYMQNGQCHCAMCGTTFAYQQYNSTPNPTYNSYNGGYNGGYNPYNSERRASLEKQKNNRLVWGIIWFFLFWPVSIYHFYKLYKITQELNRL